MPTSSFRMVTIRAVWRLEMGPATTAQALVPMILRRGSRRHPDSSDLTASFESLYGASFDVDAVKMGNAHLLVAEVEVPSDRYLPEPVGRDTLRLFGEVLRDPLLRAGRFDPDYVRQEKASLGQTLQGIFNDKGYYAHVKMLEAMFRGDPYSQTRYGTLEVLGETGPEDIFAAYETMRDEAPLAIYAVGDLDAEWLSGEAADLFGDLPPRREVPLRRPDAAPVGKVQQLREVQDVGQGKLVMGYRTGVSVFDEAFTALGVVNGLFGAYSHSNLFRNVREKASLAYYASSHLDGFKGLLTVQSGIEPAMQERTQEIIEKELEDIRQGRFTDEDMAMCQRTMENQLRAQEDSPASLIMTHYELGLAGRPFALNERLERLGRVTREDVMAAADGVRLDTVFFLTNGGETK